MSGFRVNDRVMVKMPKKCTGNFLLDIHRGRKYGAWRLLDENERAQLEENYQEFHFDLHEFVDGLGEAVTLANESGGPGTIKSRMAMREHYGRPYLMWESLCELSYAQQLMVVMWIGILFLFILRNF